QLLQQLRQGLESIAYNPFETTQLFKQQEGLHLARLRAAANTEQVAKVAGENAPPQIAEQTMPAAEIAQPEPAATGEVVTSETQPEVMTAAVETEQPVVTPTAIVDDEPQQGREPQQNHELQVDHQPQADHQPAELKAETFVVMAGSEPDVTEELAISDQHLSLVNNITQGSWFEMTDAAGQKYRCRLAAIIKATGKYIFVNRSGMKVAEETRQGLALSLKSGRLRVLDDGMLFDRALEAVIGTLREQRTTG